MQIAALTVHEDASGVWAGAEAAFIMNLLHKPAAGQRL